MPISLVGSPTVNAIYDRRPVRDNSYFDTKVKIFSRVIQIGEIVTCRYRNQSKSIVVAGQYSCSTVGVVAGQYSCSTVGFGDL